MNKKWSNTLPQASKSCSKLNTLGTDVQRYLPKEESAGIADPNMKQMIKNKESILKKYENAKDSSLIGSCRAARLKEDSTNIFQLQENFKVKSLLKQKNRSRNKEKCFFL